MRTPIYLITNDYPTLEHIKYILLKSTSSIQFEEFDSIEKRYVGKGLMSHGGNSTMRIKRFCINENSDKFPIITDTAKNAKVFKVKDIDEEATREAWASVYLDENKSNHPDTQKQLEELTMPPMPEGIVFESGYSMSLSLAPLNIRLARQWKEIIQRLKEDDSFITLLDCQL